MNDYLDIINVIYKKSNKRPRMSLLNRAAQFMPFSALNGFEELIIKKGKDVVLKPEISDEMKEIINKKLLFIKENKNIVVKIDYFSKDEMLNGGVINTCIGNIIIDEINNLIIVNEELIISFEDILDMDIEY